MKKLLINNKLHIVAIILISIGFVVLQMYTNQWIRLFWQEIFFSFALILYLKIVKIKVWKLCTFISMLHLLLMYISNTSNVSQKNILPAYWITLAVCIVLALLITLISKISNKPKHTLHFKKWNFYLEQIDYITNRHNEHKSDKYKESNCIYKSKNFWWNLFFCDCFNTNKQKPTSI